MVARLTLNLKISWSTCEEEFERYQGNKHLRGCSTRIFFLKDHNGTRQIIKYNLWHWVHSGQGEGSEKWGQELKKPNKYFFAINFWLKRNIEIQRSASLNAFFTKKSRLKVTLLLKSDFSILKLRPLGFQSG